MEVEIMLRGIIVISGNLCGLFNLKKKKQKKKYKKKRGKEREKRKVKKKKKKRCLQMDFNTAFRIMHLNL